MTLHPDDRMRLELMGLTLGAIEERGYFRTGTHALQPV